ncbi:tumor necrosis factor-like isoform X1 [Carcharodon carcharias]|uniref:tumor necrosis factor-like isoform X1 n=1 Tax=Carcharodon carcharias TaxID=13397 RepID=UPI001B7EF83E|nr:tumor necrosis factor-like isoform X1 [Carcharodon carcharias]
MSSKHTLLAAEVGGENVEKQTGVKSCFLGRAFCVIAVLGSVTFTAYLLLCQLGVIPSKQVLSPPPALLPLVDHHVHPTDTLPSHARLKTALIVKGERYLLADPLNDELPSLMKVMGRAPEKITVHLTASRKIKGEKRVTWRNTESLPSGVEFKDNSLIIKVPGQYFVYTQVVFYGDSCKGKTIYLSHELAKLSASYGDRITLLGAVKSVCHPVQCRPPPTRGPWPGDPWYKTIYQGAIFEFLEGDRIFSGFSENSVRYVNTEVGRTYFGLFAL